MPLGFVHFIALALGVGELPHHVRVIAERIEELDDATDFLDEPGERRHMVGLSGHAIIFDELRRDLDSDEFVARFNFFLPTRFNFVLPTLRCPRQRVPPEWPVYREARPRATLPAAPVLRRWRPMRWHTCGLSRMQRGARS